MLFNEEDELDEKVVDDDDELEDDDVGRDVTDDDEDVVVDDDADDDGSLSISNFRPSLLLLFDLDRRKDRRLKSRNEFNNKNDDGKKLNDRFVLLSLLLLLLSNLDVCFG